MKKMTLAFAFAIAAMTAQAQKNSLYIGGNVGFNSTSGSIKDASGHVSDGSKVTNWSFSPEIGTFLTNHIQLGAGITLAGKKDDARSAIKNVTKSTQTGITLYSRYFFGEGNFRPFVGVNAFALPGTQKTTVGTAVTEYKLMSFGANLNAGFAYGLNSRVTVVGSFGALGFKRDVAKEKETDVKVRSTNLGLDAGSLGDRFNVGVYYTFKK